MPKSLFAALCLLAGIAAASDYWQGTVKTPKGPLPIGILLNGQSGALDAPAFGLIDKPMTVASVAEHRLVELHVGDQVVTADLLQYGDSLAGSARVGSETYAVELHRAAKPAKTYTMEAVSIRSGDTSLPGTLYIPKGTPPYPAIVFVAGLTPRSDAVHFLADLFASRAVGVLTYDRRRAFASFSTLADDAAAAVRYVRSRREIDADRVGLRGQSQGAWIAPLAATRVPVAFIIATGGGGVHPWQSEMYAVPARMRADGFTEPEVAEAKAYMEKLFAVGRSGEGWDELSAMMHDLRSHGSRWFGKYGSTPPSLDYLRQVWEGDFSYDPAPALRRLAVPFLALEGEKDVYSPPSDTLSALESYLTTRDKTLKIIRNASHDFHVAGAALPMISDDYVAALMDWTLSHLTSGERRVEDHRIVSIDPKLNIDVDPSLNYVGTFAFDIRDAAHAERIVFADADTAGNIRRLWIAQFERMLPQHAGSYGPVQHPLQVGRYSFAESMAAKPGGEAEKTRRFLLDRGLHVDRDLMVARFESRTDPQNRSELIIFYWEELSAPGEREAFSEKARATFKVSER